jgi:hypothetical protein
MKLLNLQRSQIKLDLRIRDFVSQNKEGDFWSQLSISLASRNWPKLELDLLTSRILTIGSLIIFSGLICFAMRQQHSFVASLFASLAITLLFAILAYRLTRPLARYIPLKFKTVQDLIPLVLTSEQIKWTREDVARQVKKIVLEQLSIPESQYTEDSNFVDDLGMS